MNDNINNTYIIDAEQAAEMARLEQQARTVNDAIGALPEQILPELPEDGKILDIGCGTGTWVLDVASAYQNAAVIGYDISPMLVVYAEAKAVSRNLQNCSFEELDVLKDLSIVDNNVYDLINLRFCAGWVPKEQWLPLLKTCYRILRDGGIVVVTEGEWPYTTSKALNCLNALISQALYNAGLGLSVDGRSQGVIARMGSFLYKTGFVKTDVDIHALNFSVDRPHVHRVQYY